MLVCQAGWARVYMAIARIECSGRWHALQGLFSFPQRPGVSEADVP